MRGDEIGMAMRLRWTVVAVAVLAGLVGACGDEGVGSAGPVTMLPAITEPGAPTSTTRVSVPEPTVSSEVAAAVTSSTTTTVPIGPLRGTKVYLLLESTDPFRPGPLLVPVYREIPDTRAVATNSMEALVAGPTEEERAASPAVSTAIPPGVGVIDVDIGGGLAVVDLTSNFTTGAGTLSELARLAQVVYTLTQFSTVDAVEFRIDGIAVDAFASHGLDISRPQTRSDFESLLPFIFVDGPAYGGPAGNPARIAGQASVFESMFEFRLTDAAGGILDEGTVTGGSGLGFGPFDFTVAYDVEATQVGALTVFEVSAQSDEMVNVRVYPIRLFPQP